MVYDIQAERPVTLHHVVETALRNRLQTGEWRKGGRMPGDFALANEYRVSRATVRHALGVLAREGLIVRHRGHGTFVTGEQQDARSRFLQLAAVAPDVFDLATLVELAAQGRRALAAVRREVQRGVKRRGARGDV